MNLIIGRRIDIWDNYYNQIECSLVKELNFLNEELEETKRKLDKTIKDLSETQNQLKRLTNDNLQKDEKISTVENWIKMCKNRFQNSPKNK